MKVIMHDGSVQEFTFEDEIGRNALRHTASHILAQAVKRLFPETKLAIGPSIKDGFYYDFDRDEPFTEADLETLEAEMKKIVKENLKLERFTLPREEALALMEAKGEPYKVELIRDLPPEEEISFFRQGEFTELCAGPHVTYTSAVKAFKLTSLAGAYWRGSEKNKMLTRIYGTAFASKTELEEYLTRMEEAKRRDHRKLGKELGLFALRDEAPGMPFFLPNGMILRNTLLDYWHQVHQKWDYLEISTPQIMKRTLWETSGHWEHYKDNMYTTVIDGEDFAIKPMNCPGGILVLSTMPEDHIGSEADWEIATNALADAIKSIGKDYIINEGDGAFYGPKLDFHIEDSIGRTWQCGTIQLDYQLPGRFGLEYAGQDGEKHTPVMIHRVVFGSVERFIGVLIEHFAGKFPTWLAPVQVRLLPITDRNNDYVDALCSELKSQGVRAETDKRAEKTGFKIRDAQLKKIPYMLVIGDKEQADGTVTVRYRDSGESKTMSKEEFFSFLLEEIRTKKC